MSRKLSKSFKGMSATAVTALGLVVAGSGSALAGNDLNVLTWEGYTDPSFVSVFEEQSGCTVTPTYVGSNDEIIAKISVDCFSFGWRLYNN